MNEGCEELVSSKGKVTMIHMKSSLTTNGVNESDRNNPKGCRLFNHDIVQRQPVVTGIVSEGTVMGVSMGVSNDNSMS